MTGWREIRHQDTFGGGLAREGAIVSLSQTRARGLSYSASVKTWDGHTSGVGIFGRQVWFFFVDQPHVNLLRCQNAERPQPSTGSSKWKAWRVRIFAIFLRWTLSRLEHHPANQPIKMGQIFTDCNQRPTHLFLKSTHTQTLKVNRNFVHSTEVARLFSKNKVAWWFWRFHQGKHGHFLTFFGSILIRNVWTQVRLPGCCWDVKKSASHSEKRKQG